MHNEDIPKRLRALRGLQMLKKYMRPGGYQAAEEECPLCKGNDINCELCRGVKTVPSLLADWWRTRNAKS